MHITIRVLGCENFDCVVCKSSLTEVRRDPSEKDVEVSTDRYIYIYKACVTRLTVILALNSSIKLQVECKGEMSVADKARSFV
jgi:hypothetical protein